MGYDMSLKQEIPGQAEALAELGQRWEAAIAARDAFPPEAAGFYQEGVDKDRFLWGGTFANADPAYAAAQAAVMAISEERDRVHRSYFRLNIWGMAAYRDVMEAIGMGFWGDDGPDWPKLVDYGLTDEQSWAASDPEDYPNVQLTPEQQAAAARYRARCDQVRAYHPGETPGIPLAKFCSNDGWHVTPAECSSALQLFGEFIAKGYGDLSWQDALAAYRQADELEREIVAHAALSLHGGENAKVGHPPFGADQQDERQTAVEVLTEEYFLRWLQYLDDGTRFGGFEVY